MNGHLSAWNGGQYLVENLGCFGCHGEHDWTQHDAPLLPGTKGEGSNFSLEGLPGRVFPPNITPNPETGAGTWTDDQLARAIREGIGHDGRALFAFMPYPDFRYMSDEDLASVIVYLRSIPPVRKAVPRTEIIFPVKYLMRNDPQPITEPVPPPDLSNSGQPREVPGYHRRLHRLPHAAEAWQTDSRVGLCRRLCVERTLGHGGQRQHYARPHRNLLLR